MSEFDPRSLEPFWDSWYIDSLIGEGSYGSVYKIYREEYGEKYYCALKIISVPRTAAEERQALYDGMNELSATQYFREITEVIYKEIKIMSELKGRTNIVSYEDHKIIQKTTGTGFYILIRMELLESLNEYILQKQFTVDDVVNLGKDLCRALIICHKKNIIHRDIKPANIFVSSDGDYKLGDFGISRRLEGIQDGLSIKGTYGYMAPEVYNGSTYDERVDIYSLGMVLYYFLNNRKGPFTNSSSTVPKFSEVEEGKRRRFSGERIPSPILAPKELAIVVLKACAFDPEDRYKSAEELLKALEQHESINLVIGGDLEEEEDTGTIHVNDEVIIETPQKSRKKKYQRHKLAPNPQKMAKKVSTIPEPEGPFNLKKLIFIAAPIILVLGCICIFLYSRGYEKNDKTVIVQYNDNKEEPEEDNQEPVITSNPEPVEVVEELPDYALERDNLGWKDMSEIEDIEKLTSLSVSYNELTSIDELLNSKGLTYLNVQNNDIKDINALKEMTKLTCFTATTNQIKDVSPLGQLTALDILILSDNQIKDISALQNLTALTELRIDKNSKLSDITVLSNFSKLQILYLSGTSVNDISPLYSLEDLIMLEIVDTNISDEQIAEFEKAIPDCEVIQ